MPLPSSGDSCLGIHPDDETRLRIFEAVSATDHMKSSEIASMGGVPPATVSHHLKILSAAGLIVCRREGRLSTARRSPKTSRPTRERSRESRVAREQNATADSHNSAGNLSSTSRCTKDEHRAATLGVEEKKLQVQFAFFLRCRIGNNGQ
jgi:DNA-binding transcriptional ArsR family regulator